MDWSWDILVSVRRLAWVLIFGFSAVYLIDNGWLTPFPRTQLLVYKIGVCSISVVAAQIVWVSVIPYLSMQAIMTGRDVAGKLVATDGQAKIAVCIVRGLFFLAVMLVMGLGL